MKIKISDLKYLEVFPNIKKEFENKPLIILIHGFAIDHRCFTYFEKKITNYNYISFNLPGCGNLDNYPNKFLTLKGMCELIIEYLKINKFKNIILIGHSLGGAIAGVIASYLPDIISGTVLLSPFNKTSIPKLINKINKFNIVNYKSFYNLQKEIFVNPDETLKKIDDEDYFNESILFFKKNSKFLTKTMFSIASLTTLFFLDLRFKKNLTKTLLLVGENDKFVNVRSTINYFKANTQNIETLVFSHTGHGFFVEDEEKFIKIIFGFIKEIENESK